MDSEPKDRLHVMPLGSDWEVENEDGTPLAHAGDKAEALDLAREIAATEKADEIIVHDESGVTQTESLKE